MFAYAARLAKRNRLSIAVQAYHLKRTYPNGRATIQQNHTLIWIYETRPTPISRCYTLRIVYRLNFYPEIYVVWPSLRTLAGDRVIPHLYSQSKEQICLYRPGKGEWTSSLLIVDTIAPWVDLWLFYFEEWLLSNEWKGGGEHPPVRSSNN